MPFNPAPASWLEDLSEDGNDITIPIATFPELTAAEADGVTGDVRKLLFAVCEKLASKWAATPAADRPSKMTIVKGQAINPSTGQITSTYSFTFVTAPGSVEVVAEA